MSIQTLDTPLVLASGSQIRLSVLQGAGLTLSAVKSNVDEEAWKTSMRAENIPARDQAMKLAELKAQKISLSHEGFIIGCDQMLSLDGDIFDKPEDMAGVKSHLKALAGKTHTLETAICIAENGALIWRHLARPKLSMRPLSDAFITAYIAAHDDGLTQTVGGYQLEGLGSQLFTKIEGDYFSILGLPLLELLDYLRVRNVLLS